MAGIPSGALSLRADLQGGKTRKIASVAFGSRCAEIRLGGDSLWAIIDGPSGTGMALRCAWAPGSSMELVSKPGAEVVELRSCIGIYRVRVGAPAEDAQILRVTTTLTPSEEVNVPWWPRDLYPLGPNFDPEAAQGRVKAAQRGLNTGLVYGRLDAPAEGSFYYHQDLTALNDYFNAVGAMPDGVVGGEWPELGYCIPASHTAALTKDREVTIYDTFLRLDPQNIDCEQTEARVFLEHQAAVYPFLDRPEPQFRDWPAKAEQTLRDLQDSPLATTTDGGYLYVRPYVDAEVPDSMVQVTTLNMIREHGEWAGEASPLEARLKAGVYRFFDPEIGAVRRYLNTAGEEKKPDHVDSWYLYHPLQGLAKLARSGDEGAKEIFLKSLDYAVEVAEEFDYEWPIQFNISSLEIVTASREPGKAVGQTDAGGLYAYVMLDAHEMTGEPRFLEEAKRAIRKTECMEFDLVYQTNLTSWGAAACLRLWKATGDRFFLGQAWVFLASFFHNCAMWESRIGKVSEPTTFLGVTCLHNGPYMAPYECYESFMAFHECLAVAEDDVPDAAKLLMTEFVRYGFERGWWFYPSSLALTSLAPSPRNGEIVRDLAFPLEDLYVNGDPAGQVGQEVYGCGAAFAYATRGFHRLAEDRTLFCEYPILKIEKEGKRASFRVQGAAGAACRARLLPPEGGTVKVGGEKVDAADFEIPVGAGVEVGWRDAG